MLDINITFNEILLLFRYMSSDIVLYFVADLFSETKNTKTGET